MLKYTYSSFPNVSLPQRQLSVDNLFVVFLLFNGWKQASKGPKVKSNDGTSVLGQELQLV